ncbi:MAG: 3-oxoacyl-[acyl-carrier protein] reductase [Limisphaerales bacterium]|jgi:3-oxoacyl-[acyl-carrier protein] reductase
MICYNQKGEGMSGFALTGLEGKIAVVTGAGRMRSIGRPIAVALAQAGCRIVLTGTGRAPEAYPEDEQTSGWADIASVAEEVRAAGSEAIELVSNVADPEAVDALVAETLSHYGRVDFVINNAGAARGSDRVPVVDLAIEDWHKVMNVNLNGTFYMSRAFGQALVQQNEGGAIVNISSIAGKALPPNTAAYAASKAGIQALSASMAREVGRHNIRVNSICPGIIDTYRMDEIGRGDQWQGMLRSIPMGRAGQGEDIANMAVYLCSEQGNWITGQAYNVDGGSVVQH